MRSWRATICAAAAFGAAHGHQQLAATGSAPPLPRATIAVDLALDAHDYVSTAVLVLKSVQK
jgi:hypothetical protein